MYGPRPCVFVGCRHNLWCEVDEEGRIHPTFPGVEPEDMIESCALDVADRGGTTLEEIGEMINLTRERVRQIEIQVLGILREDLTER